MSATPGYDQAACAQRLHEGIDTLGLAATPWQTTTLLAYVDMLLRWNRRFNLTAVRDPIDAVDRHLLDCLAALPSIDRWAQVRPLRVCDVGSGGGLPGLVWAVMRPIWRVTCVDAVAKKASFVEQAAGELGIGNLRAVHIRVEAYRPESAFDLVVSRAFASLGDFVRLTRHLRAEGGVWVAMKGVDPTAEIADLPAAVEVFHVEQVCVPRGPARRCLVWMRPA